MGVLAGVAEMMGVEPALLLLVVVAVPLVAGLTLGTFGDDAVLDAVAVALGVLAAVVDDFLEEVAEEETRGFLGGDLVDFVVVSG